jgi:hypothetical protein
MYSFSGTDRELSRQIGVELRLIGYDCIQEVILGAQVCVRWLLFLNLCLRG